MLDLSVIILTGNEELHIKRCLENVLQVAKEVFVIDCYSNDRTVEIALQYKNVTVLQNIWVNYATQFNWALENAPITTEWILKLDADEYLSTDLIKRMQKELSTLPDEISAINIRLKHVFLGKFIKGGTGKKYMTRIFRKGCAVSENRQMDEHLELTSGKLIVWEEAFYDDNLNNLKWWTNKHNSYAIREAADLLDIEYSLTTYKKNGLTGQAAYQRSMKFRYAKMPLFLRAFAYFCIRYFLKGGFLEGKEGFLWCFLQGWWYRTLVDAHIFEIKKKTGGDKEKIRELFKTEYNINL